MPGPKGRATKRRRVEGGEHQRHRARLVSVLETPDASGVFMSCARGKERKAALDLVDVLNEVRRALTQHAHALYGDEHTHGTAHTPQPDDIEAQIRGELAALRAPRRSARITPLETDTECLGFVQCTPPVDAARLVTRYLEDVLHTGESRSRYVQRLAPVSALCRAEVDAIRTAATRVLPRFFPADRPRTVRRTLTQYRIEPRIRSHTSLSRDVLIPLVASCIPGEGMHRADLARPEVVVLVEVLKNVCGIGAVDAYERLGNLNVQTVAQRAGQDVASSRVAADAGRAGVARGDVPTGAERPDAERPDTQRPDAQRTEAEPTEAQHEGTHSHPPTTSSTDKA